ncbi:MAG TPA: hypothetical protein VG815_09455 [Chloroflexota bacterium]|nr:hypothetical protein [Chloroflexota bacterium]
MFVVPVLALLVVAGIYEYQQHHHHDPVTLPIAPAPRHLGLPPTGLDYYEPTGYFSGCSDWTWLSTACFRDRPASLGSGSDRVSDSAVLASDLSFVHAAHLGRLLRVWVSLDQLMRWNAKDGFSGFVPARLANLDAALQSFSRHHVKVDLVLFVYSRAKQSTWVNQFRPQALDGLHETMRARYLLALRFIIQHLAGNSSDARTVKVIDLQTEPYFQLEQYFRSAASVGVFISCLNSGTVSTSCVDQKIIDPWVTDMYRTARAASTHFLYTESDTGRLLSTSPTAQSYWMSMYHVDVYDIHMYDSAPWNHESLWATALHLRKPWFVGEAGCASGAAACTYGGLRAGPVDQWWLTNLPRYRAQSVLIESHVTLWSYPSGYRSQSLTVTGIVLECRTDPALPECVNSRIGH